MRTLLVTFFFIISFSGFAQNEKTQSLGIYGNPLYSQLEALSNGKNYEATKQLANKLIQQYSHSSTPYFHYAKALYFQQKNEEFFKYIKTATDLEPYVESPMYFMILAAILKYDVATAKKALNDFSFIYAQSYAGNLKVINSVLDYYSGYDGTKEMASQIRQAVAKYEVDYKNNIKFFFENAGTAYQVGSATFKEGKADAAVAQLLALKPKMKDGSFPISLYNQILRNISYWAFSYDAKIGNQLYPELYEQFSDKRTSTMMRYSIYVEIARINQSTRKYEDNLGISNIMLDELKSAALTNAPILDVANFKLFALIQLSRYNEAKDLAAQALKLMPEITDQEMKLWAYYNVSRAFAYGGDKAAGEAIAEQGVNYVREYGWEKFEPGAMVLENYESLKNFKNGATTVEGDINSENYIDLYNTGLGYIQIKKYAEAIPFLEKSKKLYESDMAKANEYERRSKLVFYAKVSGNLIACHQETKNYAKAFAAMEDVKANGLLASRKEKASLSEIQNSLKPDEALVYYVDVSRGFTYEGVYIGAVITKEKLFTKYIVANGYLMGTYMVYNDLIGNIEGELAKDEFRQPHYTKYEMFDPELTQLKNGEFTLLTELYRNTIIGKPGYENPGYLNEFAKSFYRAFVAPLETGFKDKKTVLFSLDGTLNFLPFESFKDESEKYLIEKYDVGYVPSGSVLKEIRNRPVKNYSKPVLAFGDARYAKLNNPGRKLGSTADIDRLSLEVRSSIEKKEPLDYAFATFSKTAMNYLQGAKAEVEAIGQLVPGTELKMNELMTENEFKRMSQAGQLRNYQAIHLSSHAMVHPYIFDLSSIAFSIFPNPKNGEDGMLTVSEMEKLNIETDFMMLSACQTGLGKLVPGEGVAGLNQAILKAGANSTLTTLWSVNDFGTSIFTIKLYDKIFNEKKTYLQAVSEVKRSFITGEYNQGGDLTSPYYWSPFVYYGK